MKRIITSTILLLIVFQSFTQDINKTILSEEDPFGLYLDDNKSDTLSYYDLTAETNNGTILILQFYYYLQTLLTWDTKMLRKPALIY